MRIGIDCRIYGPSFTGIGRYTYELVRHFIDLNQKLASPHEIVLFFNDPEYKEFKSTDNNVKKVLANCKHYSLSEQFKFPRILKKENLDIIHFPHFNIPILYRRPYIVTIHDLTLSFFPGQKMRRWYHRLAYHFTITNAVKKAKKIISVSKNTKSDLVDFLKVPAKKIIPIYNGISDQFTFLKDPREAEKTLKKHKITKEFLLYTGVWRSHKNLVNLIQAFDILKNEKKLDLQLVITGKPDQNYPEILNTIKRLNLTPDIVLPGLVSEEELNHLYNAALIYVFPSLYEGFGLPPLESMKCGTPVCASSTSSISEICGNENAIYFDPLDIREMAEKIDMLYRDSVLQGRLIERGINHAAKFTWDTTAKKTFNIILENI